MIKQAQSEKITAALAGNYDFKIMDIVRESWQKTKGMKKAFWGALIPCVFAFIGITVLFLIALALAGITISPHTHQLEIVFSLRLLWLIVFIAVLLGALLYVLPMIAGLNMIGVKRAANLPVKANMVFAYFQDRYQLFIAFICYQIILGVTTWLSDLSGKFSHIASFGIVFTLISIGFSLLYIYFFIGYLLYIPLVVEKKLTGFWALRSSRQAITHHWFKVFGLSIVLVIILMISALPFGIGLIWSMPMLNAALGILYREIFGIDNVS